MSSRSTTCAKAFGQERGGPISPLAADDARSDRLLILDVDRHKCPPVWIAASDLCDAMNTTDDDDDGRTPGSVLVARTP